MGNKSNTVKRKKDYNEYTVTLVGKMGAGKSSLGNFLLQREAFVTGDDMACVTNDNRCEIGMITDEFKLRIIDTPGFGDIREQDKVRDDVANAFYEAKDGVDAFIFVIDSVNFDSVKRIGREMVEHFEMFEKFMDHEHFCDYVIPVFTKVDERLKKRREKDFMSYGKQERNIHEELVKDGLQTLNEKIIAKARNRWMCVSSTCTGDQFYYDTIIRKLFSTIDGIRLDTGGMVCTTNIMRQAKDMDAEERANNKKAEEDEIRKVVLMLILRMLLQGDGFLDLFTDDEEGHKKENCQQGATA
eukprot:TRINITY_DN5055_c0_g1_i6.p1 TRINITY_DN5055_c0_g1~~TRINITY_DN5055_c0_g1_i6.p1  ORF type:complete len:300 (+),score=62.99 TRINITY_DN5055_c0_g1_i6:49-948(+)